MKILSTQQVRVALLATAGVVVETGGTRIMIDGLFTQDGHPFSVVPQPLYDALISGLEPLGPVHHLLFTHLHPDHFDCTETIAYLSHNTVQNVLLPVDTSKEKMRQNGLRLQYWMQAHTVPFQLMDLPAGGHAMYTLDDKISVTAFNTMHMGPQYGQVNNYCLLLHLHGKTLLFTGDAEFFNDAFVEALSGYEIDTVFINPLFYQDPRGRAILDTVIRPKRAVLYHIPFEHNDTLMMRPMVKWLIKKHKDSPYEVLALTEPDQEIFL